MTSQTEEKLHKLLFYTGYSEETDKIIINIIEDNNLGTLEGTGSGSNNVRDLGFFFNNRKDYNKAQELIKKALENNPKLDLIFDK